MFYKKVKHTNKNDTQQKQGGEKMLPYSLPKPHLEKNNKNFKVPSSCPNLN
jgi:hypothetical protein